MTDSQQTAGIDTSGSTVPPYEGRRDSAEVETDLDDDRTGPAHHAGTAGGEDQD